jgi:hypothetical protein
MTNRYDHPTCATVQQLTCNNVTGIASTTFQKILFHQKVKVLGIRSLVVTAGTNNAAGVDIYNGTTSVGSITHGTDAALSVNSSGDLNVTVDAGSFIDLRGKATSATMVNSYAIMYQVLPDDASAF